MSLAGMHNHIHLPGEKMLTNRTLEVGFSWIMIIQKLHNWLLTIGILLIAMDDKKAYLCKDPVMRHSIIH